MTFLYRLPVEEKSLKKCLLWNSFCITCHFLITLWLFGAIKWVFSMMELSISWFSILTLHLSRCSFILVIFFVFFHYLYGTGFLRIKINSAFIGAPLFLGYHFVFFILLLLFALFYASHSYEADTIAAMFIAILICVTMYPLSVHCAMVLLQAGPKEIMSSIDKCLKEVIFYCYGILWMI